MLAPPKATRPPARSRFGSLCSSVEKKMLARLEREHPGGDHRRPRPGQLVDRGGEQDEPGDRDPRLGDPQHQIRGVEHQHLAGEDELVERRR